MVPQSALRAAADTPPGAAPDAAANSASSTAQQAANVLFYFGDRSASIGADNGETAPNYPAFGPLTVRVKLGRPLAGTPTTTLALTLYQQNTSGCGMWYVMQGYSDSNYENADGPSFEFDGWVDNLGAPVTDRSYAGVMTGSAVAGMNSSDYYTLTFGACDFGRPVSIAAAPGAQYSCTWQAGPFNNYCYSSDVVGQPYMILAAAGPSEPVVLVPGIMGSVLARTSDGKELWPDIGDMASLSGITSGDAYLDGLALDAAGGQLVAMSTPDIVRTATATIAFIPVQKTFYENLIDVFTMQGYVENKDLFVAPYDWRLDLRSQNDALAAKITAAIAASPDGKINIVAHSMGGVLVKEYLAGRTDNSFLNKLVLVGVPQLGSPKAFKILNYGDNLGVALGPFDILSSAEIKKIAENMPAIYELLPSERYVNIDGGYVQDFRAGKSAVLGYDDTAHLMTSDPTDSRNANLLDAARAFHAGLDAHAVSAPSVYNIVGCSIPTISQFDLYDGGAVDVARTTGDGTVPEVSAMNLADGFHNYFVLGGTTGIDHTGLVTDARPLALIAGIIKEGIVANSDLPQDISTALADCVSGQMGSAGAPGGATPPASDDTVEFSVHGPADLSVYDSAGRHTGPLPDGTAENGVPGSSYEKIGTNVFITVPASTNTYKVVSRAVADSGTDASSTVKSVTIKAKGRKKNTVTHVATYVAVPLPQASATAELDFSGFDGNLALQLDENGDGNTNATSSPAAILTGASSTNDVTPPDITLPTIPATTIQGSTTTLTFAATDAGSGVATTMATLNGDAVANGQAITFTNIGENVLIITAIDKAGNPSVREIDLEVLAPVAPPPPPPPPEAPTSTASSTVSLSVSADTYIARSAPNKNYGTSSVLRVDDRADSRALVRFDSKALKDIVGSSTVLSAQLWFTVVGKVKDNWKNWWPWRWWWPGKLGQETLMLFRTSEPWTELGATWNCTDDTNTANAKADCKKNFWNAWSVPGMRVASAVPVATSTAGSTIRFDVTADVKNILSSAIPDDGWMVAATGLPADELVELASREASSGPTLVITRK